jgi:hypothetical protein
MKLYPLAPLAKLMCTEFVPVCALVVTTAGALAAPAVLRTVQFESSVVLPSNPSQKIAPAGQPAVPPSSEALPESAGGVFPPASEGGAPVLVVELEPVELVEPVDRLPLLLVLAPVAAVLELEELVAPPGEVLVLEELVVPRPVVEGLELVAEFWLPVELTLAVLPQATRAHEAKRSVSLRASIVDVRMGVRSRRCRSKRSLKPGTPAWRSVEQSAGPGNPDAWFGENPLRPKPRQRTLRHMPWHVSVRRAPAGHRGAAFLVVQLQIHGTAAHRIAGRRNPTGAGGR